MCPACGINRCTYQTCGPQLSGRVILACLIALIAISLFLQLTYSHLIISLNKQSSMPFVPTQTHEETGFLFQGDESSYYRIALNLLNGRGFSQSEMDQPSEPTAYRPPLFPILLATVFRVFGPSPEYGVRVNQALIALLIPLSFWLGRSLHDDRCGIAAAAVVSLWPHGLYLGNNLLTEPLYAVLIIITFGLLVKLVSSPSLGLAMAAGLAAGGAVLARSGFAITLALIGLWFLSLPKRQMPWRMALAFWGIVAITLSPWTYRNYAVMNILSPGTTGAGAVFAGAHNPKTLADRPGGWTAPLASVPDSDIDRVVHMSEAERDSYFWARGFDFLIQQPPETLLRLFVLKVLRLWIPMQRIVADETCSLCNTLTSLLFLVPFLLSILGLLLLRSQKAVFYLSIAFLAGMTLVTLVFWGGTRFRMPLEPILWTLAAYAVIRSVEGRTNSAIAQIAPTSPQFSQRGD
jgi:4-amino-4-deoxy-L-arabinose transferase-like glycosyltransferase